MWDIVGQTLDIREPPLFSCTALSWLHIPSATAPFSSDLWDVASWVYGCTLQHAACPSTYNHHNKVEPCAVHPQLTSMIWSHSRSLTPLSVGKVDKTAELTQNKDGNHTHTKWEDSQSQSHSRKQWFPVESTVSVAKVWFSQRFPQSSTSQPDSQLVC